MLTEQEIFVELLSGMHAIKKESITYQGKNLVIHDELSLEYSVIREIPDNVIIKGNLDLSYTDHLERIGDNVYVEGNLILRTSSIKELGNKLTVLGDAKLYDCPGLESIPTDVVVKGKLEISLCDISILPEEFITDGSMKIFGCNNLKKINNITVGQDFSITNCDHLKEVSNISVGQDMEIKSCDSLKKISQIDVVGNLDIAYCDYLREIRSIKVQGSLDIGSCKHLKKMIGMDVEKDLIISKCSELLSMNKLQIKGDLNLTGSEISDLPDGLNVGGSLILAQCKNIKALPNKMVIGKNLDLTETEIGKLPQDLKLAGKLYMKGCKIEKVPEGINIAEAIAEEKQELKNISIENNEQFSLFLLKEQLTTPDKINTDGEVLMIDSRLDLRGYQIEEFNVNVLINGNLILRRAKNINGQIVVNGDLIMIGSKVENFNASVTVHGNMYLTFAEVKKIPEKLIVNGNLEMKRIKSCERLPEEINVKDNLYLDLNAKNINLPRKITVGKNSNIRTHYLKGLQEIRVKGNLDLSFYLKKEFIICDMVVGGNLNLSDTEIVGMANHIVVGGNLNLACTQIAEIPETLKVGKRLILNNSFLSNYKIKEAQKKGYLTDQTVIEGDIIFTTQARSKEKKDNLSIKKIGHNVKIYGDVKFSHICIEEIGNNFTVYGNLELENAHIKKIGKGLTVYGDVTMTSSQVNPLENPNIIGKLILKKTNMNLSGDIKIGKYIYKMNSNLTTACECLTYDYEDFITEFREHIGSEDYFVYREVEEYFRLNFEIERLMKHVEVSELTKQILQLEQTLLQNKFMEVLVKACKHIDEDPDILNNLYDRITLICEEGYVTCSIGDKNIDRFSLEGYQELKQEIDLIKDVKIQEDYRLLLDFIVYKILVRDFALTEMHEAMNGIRQWGNGFALRMCDRFWEEIKDNSYGKGLTGYTLAAVLKLKRDIFAMVIGGYYYRL